MSGQPPSTVDRPPSAALILNPDTVVRPGALALLADFLRAQPRAGVAAPKLLNPDGTLQHAGFHFPGLMQNALDLFPPPGRLGWLMDSPLNGRYPVARYGGAPFRVDHTLGAAFMVRGQAVAECGMFDESFEMYCEEIDWHWRLAQAGWERWIVPAAEIVHYGGQSTAQASARSLRQLWTSRRRLHQRYHRPLFNFLLGFLVQTAMRARQRAASSEEMNLALREIMAGWKKPPPIQ
jgi:GT2 family glycosyltransferase